MTDIVSTIPDKAAIRAEIEQVRTDYHELLKSLSAEDWKKKSANPAWSVGQLMWHLGRGTEWVTENVGYCRRGKAPNPPRWIVNIGNVLLTRFGSRGATRESAAAKYDAGNAAALECLETIKDDEWGRDITSFATYNTIESTFRSVREHFLEHEADILKGLGRV